VERNNDTHPGRGCRNSPRPCRGAFIYRNIPGVHFAHPRLSSERPSRAHEPDAKINR